MKSLLNYSLKELGVELSNILVKKVPSFRAKQIFEWIFLKGVSDFEDMTNLSKDLRKDLKEKTKIFSLELEDIKRSKDKQAEKYLFYTSDKLAIETVRLVHPKRNTICVSSMVGCPLGCTFCATSYLGFKRNLDVSEILSQILILNNESKIDNVVFMGMGEPLLNTENVFKSIQILSDKQVMDFSVRRVTISTAGVVAGINEMLDFDKRIGLAVSLNSPFQTEREKIMPVTKANPLKALFKALNRYNDKSGRFTFEYVLLPGFNDTKNHAKEIIQFRKDLDFNLNIISHNSFDDSPFSTPDEKTIERFFSYFSASNVEAVRRIPKGRDIAAGCGQLAGKSGK